MLTGIIIQHKLSQGVLILLVEFGMLRLAKICIMDILTLEVLELFLHANSIKVRIENNKL